MSGPEETKGPNSEPQLDSNNYLQRLGLQPGASEQDIKARFKELVKKFHPDVNPGDPTADSRLRSIIEAYENIKLGIFQKLGAGSSGRVHRHDRGPRTTDNPQTMKRASELKIEAADVENFEHGGEVAVKINSELSQSGKKDELLGYLTRRLQFLLQQKIKKCPDLESLAELAQEINTFADSAQGRLLFTSFFTDELDVTALNMGLDTLTRANTKPDIENAQTALAKYPFTFGAIAEVPFAEGKEDTMAKLRFLGKIKTVRPRTGERLDKLVNEVNEYKFTDEKRGEVYKKQIIGVIERHRKVYFRNGVFTPLRGISPQEE